MSGGLHPAIATLAGVFLIVAYLYGGYWITSVEDEGTFDVATVLASLLRIEASVMVRQGVNVAVGFGGCRDRLATSVDALQQLGASCPDSVSNLNELNDVADLEKTFAYYFQNGVSAGRATKNTSFFADVEHAFTSLATSRESIGGNAPVMVQRFVMEGVDHVLLGANMSPELRWKLDPRIKGSELTDAEQDTHLILEYEKDDKCGEYTAPRANRFIIYKSDGGHHRLTSLVEQFTRELMKSPPDLLVIGGLRQLLSADTMPVAGPSPLTRLSQMLTAARPSMRVHVELSTFADETQLHRVIELVVRHADSIGLNEQELPALRRQLVNWHSSENVDETVTTASDSSAPTVASVLDDARQAFQLLRHIAARSQRHFSRLHMHTLAFQVIVTEAESKLWPNTRAALAKASLTGYRYTCGSSTIDVDRAKLLLYDSALISMEIGTAASEHRVHFTGHNPVVCWREEAGNVEIEICIAPVLVCKHVVQTAGGGDNISAAGLVLQI